MPLEKTSGSAVLDFVPVAFSRWPFMWLWFLGWIPRSIIFERLSGWWKNVMKWCDITKVDEPKAKLWPDATSLLLTDDWQPGHAVSYNSIHWQTGTVKGHFTGDVSTILSGKWHIQVGWVYLLSSQNVNFFFFYPAPWIWIKLLFKS